MPAARGQADSVDSPFVQERGGASQCAYHLAGAQCARLGAELIVAHTASPVEVAILGRANSDVCFVRAPVDSTVPQLRSLGLAEAAGDIVVLIEEREVLDGGWLRTVVQHTISSDGEVGNRVDNVQPEGTVDWSAYLAALGYITSRRREPDHSATANWAGEGTRYDDAV